MCDLDAYKHTHICVCMYVCIYYMYMYKQKLYHVLKVLEYMYKTRKFL